MYCKVCGKDLNEKDKFCSNCGAKVSVADAEPEEGFSEETGFVTGAVDFEKEECEDKSDAKEMLSAARHIDFDWDLGGFPPERNVDPAKADFNWSSVVDDRQKVTDKTDEVESVFREEDIFRGEPASFDWGLGTTTRLDRSGMEAAAEEAARAKEMPQDVTDVSELAEDDSLEGQSGEPEKRKIDKFYTFNKKNEEFQALLDQEYERLKKRIHEENEAEEALASKAEKLEKARDSWGNTDIEPDEENVAVSENPDQQPIESVESVEVNDSEISEKVEDRMGADRLKSALKKVIKPKYPAPENHFDVPFDSIESGVIGIYQPIGTTIADLSVKAEAAKAKPVAPKKNKIKYSDIFEPENFEEENEAPKSKKHDTERKSGKSGKKIFLDIIIVILALVVILASILLFAKDSVPGMYIQKGIDKVAGLFGFDDEVQETGVPSDVTTAMSKVIDAERAKAPNIPEIKEGANLGFDHDNDYGIEGFADSAAFTDSVWYTDDNGKTVNYGNVIVGDIISYYSHLVDFRNGANDALLDLLVPDSDFYHEIEALSPVENKGFAVTALEFGEIRTADNNYYVLIQVSEIEDAGEPATTGRKIVQLVSEDKTMEIVRIKDI